LNLRRSVHVQPPPEAGIVRPSRISAAISFFTMLS